MPKRVVLTGELRPNDVVAEDDALWTIVSTHKIEGGWHVVFLEGWDVTVENDYTWLRIT